MENLRIYKTSIELTAKVYELIRKQKTLFKDYSLSDQLKRASVSIPANIAEGYKRTPKHFKNFLQIASGSANEVVALLQVIEVVHRIDTKDLQEDYKLIGKQINAFSFKLKTDSR